MMTAGPVMLGYPTGGWNRNEFMGAVLNAVSGPNSDPAIGGVISACSPLLAFNRNKLVTQFLEHSLEWLCMVDTDIVFSTDAVSRLLDSADPIERPVISALYFVFENGVKTPAAYLNTAKPGEDLDVRAIAETNDKVVGRVFATGAGFLLVHRSVYETIQKDSGGDTCWFREGVIDQRDFGEDISFCIRAGISGFPVHVNTGVRVGHIKSAMLGEVK